MTTTATRPIPSATHWVRRSRRSPSTSHAEGDGHQRVHEIAEGGGDDMVVVDGIDVDTPVDRDEQAREGQSPEGAAGDRVAVDGATSRISPVDRVRERDPAGEHLERPGGVEQREVEREAPPDRVCEDAVRVTPAFHTRDASGSQDRRRSRGFRSGRPAVAGWWCRSHLHAETLEDRPAVGRAVDLQPAVAGLGGQHRTAPDERAGRRRVPRQSAHASSRPRGWRTARPDGRRTHPWLTT